MPPKKTTEPAEPDAFVQQYDDKGAVRLDRKLTPNEAADVDAENRKRFLENRRKRFVGDAQPEPGKPYEG